MNKKKSEASIGKIDIKSSEKAQKDKNIIYATTGNHRLIHKKLEG